MCQQLIFIEGIHRATHSGKTFILRKAFYDDRCCKMVQSPSGLDTDVISEAAAIDPFSGTRTFRTSTVGGVAAIVRAVKDA